MRKSTPSVSIGLPVYNGETYIREAIDSILSQTYVDFELIIVDNASTDQTQKICLAYTDKDDRVRYIRNPHNVGAAENHNRAFRLSRSKYFKWAAHDDIIAPEYLSKCVSALEQDSSIALCQTLTLRIDEKGVPSKKSHFLIRENSDKLYLRFGDLIKFNYPVFQIHGVIRHSVLKNTHLFGNYIGADRNLLAEIALQGRLFTISEYLFFNRYYPDRYSLKYFNRPYPDYQSAWRWWTPAQPVKLPYLKRFTEYFFSVNNASLTTLERLLCYTQIAKLLLTVGWR
ncbi:MAG: glycosyltransferase family 2 protein, partial [Candidatus Bathyarchaeota archaeon]